MAELSESAISEANATLSLPARTRPLLARDTDRLGFRRLGRPLGLEKTEPQVFQPFLSGAIELATFFKE